GRAKGQGCRRGAAAQVDRPGAAKGREAAAGRVVEVDLSDARPDGPREVAVGAAAEADLDHAAHHVDADVGQILAAAHDVVRLPDGPAEGGLAGVAQVPGEAGAVVRPGHGERVADVVQDGRAEADLLDGPSVGTRRAVGDAEGAHGG